MTLTFDFVIDENTPFPTGSVSASELMMYVGSATVLTLTSTGSIDWSLPEVDSGTLGITANWNFSVPLNDFFNGDSDNQGTGTVNMRLNGPTAGLDYESFSTGTAPTFTLTVSGALNSLDIMDSNRNPIDFKLNLKINDVNEAPTIGGLNSIINVNENYSGTVASFTLTDPDIYTSAFQSNTLSVSDNRFTIVPTTTAGVYNLQLINPLDYEASTDKSFNITVTAKDTTNLSITSSKTIAVNVVDVLENTAPTVTGETVSTSQNTGNPVTSVTVELGDNLSDSDPNGLANSMLNVTDTTNGTIASIDQDARSVTFTPTAGFSGTASFNYTLTDAGGLKSNTATVIIQVGSIISAGNGSDRIRGFGGNDRLSGNNGNDTLNGGDGNDSLFGGNGTDVLLGGNGDDLLDGGNGADTETGGAGADRFVLTSNAGGDTITDFADTSDRIALSGGLTFGQLTIAASGSNTAIRLGTTTLVTLTGVSANLITAADFVTV